MDPEHWRRVSALFDGALEQPADRRDAWLERECRGDAALRAEVASLLAAEQQDDQVGIVGDAARATLADSAPDAWIGRVIGVHRVLREIGRGGMGVVYLAERADGAYEQQVAIKVVRERTTRPECVARFSSERRLLARLGHPNIARLMDAGTATDGSPYVVMEYVDGLPLDAHCRERRLSVRQRLELFIDICRAVHDAHRNLIVHRDLKPSNVLVTADGIPKLLDFGVARLLDPDDAPGDRPTATLARAMTPLYASPEQIRGEPVNTASDVYSLGVVLYEILSGRPPYAANGGSIGELERAVCESDPDRPSVTVTREPVDTEESHPIEPSELKGDLDNIVMKAMRKEPERRYASAAELAEDLRRHLDGLPVSARPDTWTYRFGRFVARNRALSLALAAAVALLIAGTVTSTVLATRAVEARRVAERQAAMSRAVSDFLNVDVLSRADPHEETDRDITLREVIDRTSERVGGGFEGEPMVEAGVRMILARTYENLGELETAERHYRRANALMTDQVGERDETTLACRTGLAGVLYRSGRYDEAESLLLDVRRAAAQALPEDHPVSVTALDNLAEIYDAQGRTSEAIATSRQAVEAHRHVFGQEDPSTLTAMSNLALIYEDQDRFDDSEPLLIDVLDARRRVLGDTNPDTLLSMASLGFHYVLTGDPERAEPLLVEAVETGAPVLGPTHPWQMNHEGLLAYLYETMDRYEQAEALYASVFERQREQFGMDNPLTLRSLLALAGIYASTGRIEQAEDAYLRAVERRRDLYGPTHAATVSALRSFAAALRAADRCDRLLERLSAPVAELRATRPEPNRHLGALLVDFGRCRALQDPAGDAETYLSEGREVLATTLGEDHEQTRAADEDLAALRE